MVLTIRACLKTSSFEKLVDLVSGCTATQGSDDDWHIVLTQRPQTKPSCSSMPDTPFCQLVHEV